MGYFSNVVMCCYVRFDGCAHEADGCFVYICSMQSSGVCMYTSDELGRAISGTRYIYLCINPEYFT